MGKVGDVYVEPVGPLDADILLVGEAPGEEEEKEGKPFVGRAGQFMEKMIFRSLRSDRSLLRITNAVPYRVRDTKGENTQPTIAQIREYRGHVEEEIDRLRPKVVIALGSTALHCLLPTLYRQKTEEDEKKSGGVRGINKWRGKQIWQKNYNCWVVPTFHPSALARDFTELVTWRLKLTKEDFKLALKLSRKPRPKMSLPRSVVAAKVSEARAILKDALKKPIVAVDTESASLDRHSQFLGASFCFEPTTGYYLPASVIEGDLQTRTLFDKLLGEGTVCKLFHNGAHDERYLQAHGFQRFRNWADTMLAAQLVDENFPKSLKALTWRYLTFGGYDQELLDYIRLNKIESYADVPPEVLWPYGGYDAVATFQLWRLFKEKLSEEDMLDYFTSVVMPTRQVLNKIQVNGFAVNHPYLDSLLEKSERAVERLEQRVYQEAGKTFNLRSTKQLQTVLFSELGLIPLRQTPGGAYSCAEESLEALAKQPKGDIARYLLDIRYIHTMRDHFLTKIASAVNPDGRVRANYDSAGTVTGRTSVSEPPLHGIPRDRYVRTVFVARKGWKLVVMDVMSAELRAMAAYCGDENLLKAFAEGRDLHSATYNMMYGKPADNVPSDEERQIGKTINFALIYRETVWGLAHQLGVPVDVAQDYLNRYFKRFPKVKRYMDESIEFCKKHGYVATLLGRRRHLPDILADDKRTYLHAERQVVNSPVQGVANDITNIAMIRLDSWYTKYGMQAQMVHNVHDSIVTECPDSEVKQVVKLNYAAVRMGVAGVNVQFDCEVEVEQMWGEHKKTSKLQECFARAGIETIEEEKTCRQTKSRKTSRRGLSV